MTKFKTWLLRRDKLVLICGIVLIGILIRFALRTHNAVVVNDSLWQFISFGKLFLPLETILLAVAISLMTISAFFDVRKSGASFKLFVAVASSLFLHAIIIGAHIFAYNLATKIADFLYSPESTISHYQEIVERDDTDAKYKAFFSAAIAREKFINRGEISKYIDEKVKFAHLNQMSVI